MNGIARIGVAALGLAVSGCVMPTSPGEVVLGRFTAADGTTIVLSRPSADATVTILSAPSSVYGPLAVRSLRGLAHTTVAGSAIGGDRLVLLVTGSAPDCQIRNVLLANRLPETAQLTIPGCDRIFTVSQRSGGDVLLMQAGVSDPVYYVFRNNTLYGPQRSSIAARVAVSRPAPHRQAVRQTPQPTAAGSPIDLDSLPLPSNRQGVDLDH